jgi:hypothetical protein
MALAENGVQWRVLALALLALAGCQRPPRAPALVNEPVYQDSREGFRFLVPDGSVQEARGEMPPAPVEDERMLVEYRLPATRRSPSG